MAAEGRPRARRGSTNRDRRGGTPARRARRQYLVTTYRADAPLVASWWSDGTIQVTGVPFTDEAGETRDCDVAAWVESLWRINAAREEGQGREVAGAALLLAVVVLPAARCYRCGALLHAGAEAPQEGLPALEGTVTADRIIPGGSYRRENIRPACGPCQEHTGGKLGAERRKVGRGTSRGRS